ncbi:MAG: hypothetical protein ACI33K_13805 [Clostridiaceae bacterium]
MDFLKLLVLAVLCEAIWETLKLLWENGRASIDRIGAIAVGLILTITTRMDILALVGLPSITPLVGMILGGIIISRGANFVHDLIKRVQSDKTN